MGEATYTTSRSAVHPPRHPIQRLLPQLPPTGTGGALLRLSDRHVPPGHRHQMLLSELVIQSVNLLGGPVVTPGELGVTQVIGVSRPSCPSGPEVPVPADDEFGSSLAPSAVP